MKRLEKDSLQILKDTIFHRAKIFPRDEFIRKLIDNDKAYYMSANQRKNITNKEDEKKRNSRYEESGIGIVNPAVEAEVAFMNGLFLSDPKIFSIVSSAKNVELGKAVQALNQQHSRFTKWQKHFLKFFRDNAKYNVGFLHVYWDYKQTYIPSVTADFKNTELKMQIWSGNRIERVDPYNSIFDISVAPTDLAEYGEFFGIPEVLSQTNLFRRLKSYKAKDEDSIYNETAEMWKSSNNGIDDDIKYREPPLEEIIPDFSRTGEIEKTVNWLEMAGISEIAAKGKFPKTDNLYQVLTWYLRLIPEIYGIPADAADQDQIWKIVLVNGEHIVHVTRETNAHDLLPVGVSQPIEDSLAHNTQGTTRILAASQKLAKQLVDRRLASLDRNINDKAIYDPNAINEDHLKSEYSDGKIPLKKTSSEVELKRVYMQIPFTDTSSQLIGQELAFVMQNADELSGINKATRGQFTKGNRTLEEFDTIMSNADSKQFTRAGAIESQCFSVVKHILKWNVVQFATEEDLTEESTGESIKFNPEQLNASVFDFKLADGLNPASKFLNANETLQLFQILQLVAQQQNIPMNFMQMLNHILLQGKNIDISEYIQAPAAGSGGEGT